GDLEVEGDLDGVADGGVRLLRADDEDLDRGLLAGPLPGARKLLGISPFGEGDGEEENGEGGLESHHISIVNTPGSSYISGRRILRRKPWANRPFSRPRRAPSRSTFSTRKPPRRSPTSRSSRTPTTTT